MILNKNKTIAGLKALFLSLFFVLSFSGVFAREHENVAEEKTVKENIGLANLRRQLELLYTDFSLVAAQGKSVFTASLKINLASHV